jgi:hypothetical protein
MRCKLYQGKILKKEELNIDSNSIKNINELCGKIDDKLERELVKNDMLYDEIDIS